MIKIYFLYYSTTSRILLFSIKNSNHHFRLPTTLKTDPTKFVGPNLIKKIIQQLFLAHYNSDAIEIAKKKKVASYYGVATISALLFQ